MGLFSALGGLVGSVFPGVGTAIGAGLGGLLDSSIGGKKDKKAAQQAVQQSTPYAYSSSGPYGNVFVDPSSRQVSFGMGDSPWAPMLQALGMSSFANAATAPGAAYYGASPEIVQAAQGFTPEGMNDAFSSELSRLRSIAEPNERRSFQALGDRLFSLGQLGTSGGVDRQAQFDEAMQVADLQRQGAAQDFARQRSMDRFSSALQAVGSGQQGQTIQAGIGQNAFGGFQGLLDGLLRQGQLGMSAGTATPGGVALAAADTKMANDPWKMLEASGVPESIFGAIGKKFGWGSGGNTPLPGGAGGLPPLDFTPQWTGGYQYGS